jgi:hypothetical protein
MKNIMIRKLSQFLFMIMVLLVTGCVKETYNMKKLSKDVHLSPTLAISAVKGNVSFSDMVKSNDTIVFDKNTNLVRLVFKKDSVIDLTMADFFSLKNISGLQGNDMMQSDPTLFNPSKALPGILSATIEPQTLKLELGDVFSHISGDFLISDPSLKLYYSNSFAVPVKIIMDAIGKRKGKPDVSLDLDTFNLSLPSALNQTVSDIFLIDKSNSSLPKLISMPPDEIQFSGNAILFSSGLKSQDLSNALGVGHIFGRLEIEIPLEFRTNNLVFKDTLDNFMKGDSNNSIKPEDFEFMRVDVTAKNGFPFGVSLEMSLIDSTSQITSTVDATSLLEPAPVGSNGKVSGTTDTETTIEFSKEFFSAAGKADKIIFQFTINTTDSGSKDVKIYSDYRIEFNAALVVKPNITLK